MFSDLKGFTRPSEEMDPQKLVAFLNVYMSAMTEIIIEHGGSIDKFMGDGIMAVFNTAGVHVEQALLAGIKMQQQLESLRYEWRTNRPELASLQMRIGINTGDVVAGNIGSETRMDYTLVGDNVNVAARLESACIPGELLLSEASYGLVKHRALAKPMEPILVRNREKPVATYAVQVEREPPQGKE